VIGEAACFLAASSTIPLQLLRLLAGANVIDCPLGFSNLIKPC
jgi:hypothetical protein